MKKIVKLEQELIYKERYLNLEKKLPVRKLHDTNEYSLVFRFTFDRAVYDKISKGDKSHFELLKLFSELIENKIRN